MNQGVATSNSPTFVDVTASSDSRLKTEIATIESALEKVMQLRGVRYRSTQTNQLALGVIAQEVEPIIPEVVKQDSDGYLSVAYGNITGLLIEAIKQLKLELDNISRRL